jgi:hypothetical protein
MIISLEPLTSRSKGSDYCKIRNLHRYQITRQKPSFATIRKYALLCAILDHDMFRPS